MFRASNAHLQEDTVVYMQHMVLSLSMRVPGGLLVHSLRTDCRGKVVGGVLRHLPTTFPLQSVLTFFFLRKLYLSYIYKFRNAI